MGRSPDLSCLVDKKLHLGSFRGVFSHLGVNIKSNMFDIIACLSFVFD